jgi:DNA-binding transcriptional ArsR family regulator
MTTAKEARQLRERIYRLSLKGISNAEIARAVDIDESNVSRHLATIRRSNVEWFDQHKDPDGRLRAFFKEYADKLNEIYRETWIQWNQALNPQPTDRNPNPQPTSIQNRIGLLNTMLNALRELRIHYRMVAPSMDEVYYRQQLEELKKAIYEKRQAEKVNPIART